MPSEHMLLTKHVLKTGKAASNMHESYSSFHINQALVHSRTHKFLPKYTHYQ